MSVLRWPDTLPVGSAPGYDLAPMDQVLRTQMEVGARRKRRISFADLDEVGFEWRMTDPQFRAFRDLHRNRSVSLAGASDDLAAWTLSNATRFVAAAISPDGIAVDRLKENAVGPGAHTASIALPGANLNGLNVLCRASIRAAGRTKARVALIDRASAVNYADVDLTAGTLSNVTGLTSATIEDRTGGWWRINWTSGTGTGSASPAMQIALEDATGATIYTVDATKGIDICEVQARIVTGYDLFVPSDGNGNALGFAGGGAWVIMPLATGGGLIRAEASFTGPYAANAGPGLIWTVKGKMEVRNA